MRTGRNKVGMWAARATGRRSARRGYDWMQTLESRLLLSSATIDVAAGPITRIYVNDDTAIQVHYTGLSSGQFYPSGSEPGASGFFIRQADGFVNGPASVPAGSSAHSHGFTPVSQTTSSDGHTITTVFTNSTATGSNLTFQVTQTLTYTPGDQFFTVTNVIQNTGGSTINFDAFAAGDIYLAESDSGIGLYDPATKAIGGTNNDGTYNIVLQAQGGTLQPTNYQEDGYDTIWSIIGGNGPTTYGASASDFNNTAKLPSSGPPYNSDPNYIDNGAGLQWKNVSIAAGASQTIGYYWGFGASVTDVLPPIEPTVPTTPTTPTEPTEPGVPGNAVFAIGTEAGQAPVVKVYNADTGAVSYTITPYDQAFTGGVRVAMGDVNGDGVADIITAPGAHSVPLIQVYNGVDGTLLANFYAYQQEYSGGVFVATGDVNHNGRASIIVGTDQGGVPLVQVYNGTSGQLESNFFAFDQSFTGGVRLATGDVNADGHADIIAATGPGAEGTVRLFSGSTGQHFSDSDVVPSAGWTGGLFVTAGNFHDAGAAQVAVTFDTNGLPLVNVYNVTPGAATPVSLANNFWAYPLQDEPGYPGHPAYTGGVRISAADVDGDGLSDILLGTGQESNPYLRIFKGNTQAELKNFYVFPDTWRNGFFVGAANNQTVHLS